MAEFDLGKMADRVADKALDEFLYKGKTIREWVELMVTAESVVEVRMVEELEKIKARLNHRANEHLDGDYYVRIKDINEVFDEELAELKGENNDRRRYH